MSRQPAWQHQLDFFGARPIVIEPSQALLSSDGGLLPIRQFDERIRLTATFAQALDDPRDPALSAHTFLEMVRSRIYGILADYEDQNDHDTLRSDPVFKLIAGRSPDGDDLASQPTLSRFENSITIASLKRLRDVFIDQFIASFAQPPRRLVFDLDAVDDPAHGHQQLTFWHGFYDQNQYLPLFITCADNDQFVMLSLRPGTVHAALGADDDLEYLVKRLRQVWPDVVIYVRGDGGFGVPWMYDICERLRIYYTFGLSSNAVLRRDSDALLAQAVAAYDQARQQAALQEPRPDVPPQRLFQGFGYQAGSWPHTRHVIAKAEANAQGTNRRFIVSNRPGAELLPEATYDEYVLRGESENRNKEFKCDLAMDRLSDHRFLANYFRLYLHAAAMNLLVQLRRCVAEPLPGAAPAASSGEALANQAAADTPTEPLPGAAPAPSPVEALANQAAADTPTEALTGAARQRHFRRRRQRDPLGEGHPGTWRTLLIKVAVEVVVSSRRVWVRLSSSWPHLSWYRRVCERLHGRGDPAPGATG